ncbi:hypothetical protein DERF_000369 [Dermatophagoides farinae]|uniref:Uncharacterized protein n=1 Tax=Dermatophagoides farinae TaxID=6954 RepID=A0A922L8K6_DERFA|nr:hypothetical protein DERF_000369 [Dermatophagoides farinae]
MAQNPDDISMVIQMMIPYKTVYGFPKKCSKITEYQTITEADLRENYRTCQMEALKRWRITFYSYYTETSNFCCFVYDVLHCENRALYECDSDYADNNEKETRRLFDKSCESIMMNNGCNMDGDGNNHKILVYVTTGVVVIVAIVSLTYFGWKMYSQYYGKSQELKLEMNAKKAFKKEKFDRLYEIESIHKVYDNELDNMDNEWLQKMTELMMEKEKLKKNKGWFSAIFGSKKEKIKQKNIEKKNLMVNFKNNFRKKFKDPEKQAEKMMKKKIWSIINEDSENNPNFWNDFHIENYYPESSNVTNTGWKFSLRSKKKVKDVEKNQKRDELIRAEVRLQYEDIRKDNRRRLNEDQLYYQKLEKMAKKKKKNKPKKFGGYDLTDDEMSVIERKLDRMISPRKKIEDKETDQLLAKMISILNQEQVDVHHEMLRTKNFAEFKEMNQLETWSTKLKDSRTRIRNSRQVEAILEALPPPPRPPNVIKIPALVDKNLETKMTKKENWIHRILPKKFKKQKQPQPSEVDLNQETAAKIAKRKSSIDMNQSEQQQTLTTTTKKIYSIQEQRQNMETSIEEAYEKYFKFPWVINHDKLEQERKLWQQKKADYESKISELEQIQPKGFLKNLFSTDKSKNDKQQQLDKNQLKQIPKQLKKLKEEFKTEELKWNQREKYLIKVMNSTEKEMDRMVDKMKKSIAASKEEFQKKKEMKNIFDVSKTSKTKIEKLKGAISLLTEEEKNLLQQEIFIKPKEQGKQISDYRRHVYEEMLEFEKLIAKDENKIIQAIRWRDQYIKPLLSELRDEQKNILSTTTTTTTTNILDDSGTKMKPILTDNERKFLYNKIYVKPRKQGQKISKYRSYILNEIENYEQKPISENDRKYLRKTMVNILMQEMPEKKVKEKRLFSKIFSNSNHDASGMMIDELITRDEKEYLYYEIFVKPRLQDRPVDTSLWFHYELFKSHTTGKFYDQSQYRYHIDRESVSKYLKQKLQQSINDDGGGGKAFSIMNINNNNKNFSIT